MSKLQILTNLNEFKCLLDLYRIRLPATIHGYCILKNFIEWFELNPNIDHLSVYVLENWKESGLFFILDRYHMFVNAFNSNEHELEHALKMWDWSQEYKIFALPAALYSVVEKTLRDLKVSIRSASLKTYQRDSSLINDVTIEIPDFLTLRSLSINDANIVNDVWYSHQNGSLEFIQSLIKYNISLGLYTKDTNELVAWCTRCQCGFLGTLHVKDQFRGQGLAMILVEEFSQKVMERGEEVRTVINDDNLPSQKLFCKLGFTSQEDVFIMYTKP